MKKEFVKKYLNVLPESARGELKNSISRQSRMLDDLVDDMFNFLMTVPTKKLSRAPAFKFHYWNKVGDFGQHLNAATLKKVVKLAEDAGLATGTAREKRYWIAKCRRSFYFLHLQSWDTLRNDKNLYLLFV